MKNIQTKIIFLKKIVSLVVLFSCTYSAISQKNLSAFAEISLLSCENGIEAYNSYGHSALRVKDSLSHIDIVFNYGTFDFNTEYFIPKFVLGTLDYELSIGYYRNFIRSYQYENRTVIEQILDLNSNEKQALFDRLMLNYETDEKYYRYDFFYDNCSSRIHEILKEVLGDSLSYGNSLNEKSSMSFRDLIDPYTKHSPWLDFGIGLIMGKPTDQLASHKEKMFLPEFLMQAFDRAIYRGKALVKTKRVLFQSKKLVLDLKWYKSPIFVFSLLALLILIISIHNHFKLKHWIGIDYFLFSVSGLIGVFFLFMWIATRHTPTYLNLNMFWAMPFNLIAVFFLNTPKLNFYLKFMILLQVIGYFLLPQVFPIAILPIVFLFLTRYVKLFLKNKKSLEKENI